MAISVTAARSIGTKLARESASSAAVRAFPRAVGSLTTTPLTGSSSTTARAASISRRSNELDQQQQQQQTPQQGKRWKHAAKDTLYISKLDEIAHRPEREAAEVRRQKKKDRKAAKKGKHDDAGDGDSSEKKKKKMNTTANEGLSEHGHEDRDEELDDHGDDDDDAAADADDGSSEPSLPDPARVKERMIRSVQKFQDSLKTIRGIDPTPEIFDDVQVNAYGEMTPLVSLGQVIITSPTLAHINCFDPAVSKEVQRAVQLTMGLNPQLEEGGIVKVPLPRVSLETRQATAKQLSKMAESCRHRIRGHRRKAMDAVKMGKDGKIPGVSKDDAFANGKEIDAITDDANATIKKLTDEKMAAILKA